MTLARQEARPPVLLSWCCDAADVWRSHVLVRWSCCSWQGRGLLSSSLDAKMLGDPERVRLLSACFAAALWGSSERTALLGSCCCTGRVESRSALALAALGLSTNLIDNSSRILSSSLFCCCLLGNSEKGWNFPSVLATELNGPLYCWNSTAPLARQAGDTYFLGDVSQASFILRCRISILCFLREFCLFSGAELMCFTTA